MTASGGDMHDTTSRFAPLSLPRGAASRSLAILVLLYLVSCLDRQILSLVILPLQADLKLSDTQLGTISGLAFVAFYAVTGLVIGWCVDRWSKRWILFFGVAVWSLATIACGLAQSFGELFAARLIVGFGEATLAPAAVAIIGRLFARERLATANGFFYMAPNLGGGLLFLIGGISLGYLNHAGGLTLPLIGHLAPWRTIFVLAGLPGLPIALLAFAIHEPRDAGPATVDLGIHDASLRLFARERGKLWLVQALTFGFTAAPSTATMVWAPAYFARTYAMTPAEVGLSIAVASGIFATLSQFLWGAVIDRISARGVLDAHYRVYAILPVCGVPLMVLTYGGFGAAVSLVSLCLLWLVALGTGPLASALQLFTPAHLRGRVSAISHLPNAIFGIGLAPFLVGLITDHVFHDRALIGWSIIVVGCFFQLTAATILFCSRGLLARTVAADHGLPIPA